MTKQCLCPYFFAIILPLSAKKAQDKAIPP